MPRGLLPAALLACQIVLAAVLCPAFPNEPEGFGGLAWGAPEEGSVGFTFLRESAERVGFKVYRRAGEEFVVEGIPLEGAEYEFWRGKFVLVTARVLPLSAFIELRDRLFVRHGRGGEPSVRAERYYWEGAEGRIALISRFDIS